MSNQKLDRIVRTVAVVGSLVGLNVLGLALFGRLDFTRDRQFTLSDATLSTLRAVHEPLTIRAYFTKDLPPPHATQARYVHDLLEEYYAHAGGMLRFEFIDPAAAESSEDKEKKKDVKQDIFGRQLREATAIEQELNQLGIPPVQVRVNQDDRLEVKRAYMGLAVTYNERKEVIPVVSDTTGLEYDLTTLIRKLTRPANMRVGLASGHGGPTPQEDFGKGYGLLTQLFDVREVDLKMPGALAELDALLLIGPKTPLNGEEKQALDTFARAGHGVGIFAGPVQANLSTLASEAADSGLNDLLVRWGAVPEAGLVADAECATVSIAQQAGFMRFNQPVRYPLMPSPKSLDDTPLTRGLGTVVLPFVAPLRLTAPEGGPVQINVLARSSADSWVQPPPANLDPMQRWEAPANRPGKLPLMVTLTGTLPAAVGGTDPNATSAPEAARVLVAGGHALFTDPFLAKSNETLLMNFVDWLVRDDGLLAVRSRGLAAAPLRDVSDATRNGLKYLNILGLPTALVGFGLVRWRRREARRDKVAL